jgi:hypothetical protein
MLLESLLHTYISFGSKFCPSLWELFVFEFLLGVSENIHFPLFW